MPISPLDLVINPDITFANWTTRLRDAMQHAGVGTTQLAASLNISESSLYKRFKGTTRWPADEYLRVSAAFRLDANLPVRAPKSELRLHVSAQPDDHFDATHYLAALSGGVREFAGSDALLRIVSTDLPIFYLFDAPQLLAVKLYLFERARATTRMRPLNVLQLSQLAKIAEQHATDYNAFFTTPRQEVWGPSPLATFLTQLQQLRQREAIDAEALILVLDNLDILVARLADQVYERGRDTTGTCKLRYDPELLTTTLFHAHVASGTCSAFITFDAPHHFRTSDGAGCAYFANYADAAFARARPLNGQREAAELYANRLQNMCKLKLAKLRHMV